MPVGSLVAPLGYGGRTHEDRLILAELRLLSVQQSELLVALHHRVVRLSAEQFD